MIRVGVVGLGMMGLTHLDVYRKHKDVRIVAICDSDRIVFRGRPRRREMWKDRPSRRRRSEDVQRLTDIHQVIRNPEIDLVDICLPTDLHAGFSCEVLQAGTTPDGRKAAGPFGGRGSDPAEAEAAANGMAFVGHCMRFWPGWTWLKEAIDDGRFGRVTGCRISPSREPSGRPFYSNGDRCGGAAFDLHIHDTDFVQFLLRYAQSRDQLRLFQDHESARSSDHALRVRRYSTRCGGGQLVHGRRVLTSLWRLP